MLSIRSAVVPSSAGENLTVSPSVTAVTWNAATGGDGGPVGTAGLSDEHAAQSDAQSAMAHRSAARRTERAFKCTSSSPW